MLGDPACPTPSPCVRASETGIGGGPVASRSPGRGRLREGAELVVHLNDKQGSGSHPSFVGVNALVDSAGGAR